MHLGDDLARFLAGATVEVIVVAPFIKRAALERLLAEVSSGVRITVYTRWNAYEIAAGVSDLEVLDLIVSQGATLRLVDRLHAKIFIADSSGRVGSANVTDTALGWRPYPNIELLVDVSRDDPNVVATLSEVEGESRLATVGEAELIARDAALLRVALPPSVLSHVGSTDSVIDLQGWTPQSRLPEELFPAYQERSALPESPLAMLRVDLEALRLPPGLSEAEFTYHVRLFLASVGVPSAVLRELDRGGEINEARFAEIAAELDQTILADRYISLLRWLRFFWPQRFLLEADRYKIRQGNQIV